MGDLGSVYEALRNDITDVVAPLDPDKLKTPVPATPGWTIRDVVAHLAADATYAIAGNFPSEFFQSFGDAAAVTRLNDWTKGQLSEREGRSLDALLKEWQESGDQLAAMMRGEVAWPEDTFLFIDRVIVTDAAVHQQDIFGALGLEQARDSVPIKLGVGGYVTTMGWRIASTGLPPLQLETEVKTYLAGEGEPGATVRATRFEFFRALSGRRNPEQIRGYDWEGDPEPYIELFYPYGVREEALGE